MINKQQDRQTRRKKRTKTQISSINRRHLNKGQSSHSAHDRRCMCVCIGIAGERTKREERDFGWICHSVSLTDKGACNLWKQLRTWRLLRSLFKRTDRLQCFNISTRGQCHTLFPPPRCVKETSTEVWRQKVTLLYVDTFSSDKCWVNVRQNNQHNLGVKTQSSW